MTLFLKIISSAWINRRDAFKTFGIEERKGKEGMYFPEPVARVHFMKMFFWHLSVTQTPGLAGWMSGAVHTSVLNTSVNKIYIVSIKQGLMQE